jgi:hypothetical protein
MQQQQQQQQTSVCLSSVRQSVRRPLDRLSVVRGLSESSKYTQEHKYSTYKYNGEHTVLRSTVLLWWHLSQAGVANTLQIGRG